MAWLRISLSEDEQRMVRAERDSHPVACVRRRLQVLWSLHCGLTREQAAKVAGVAVSTVQRDVSLYRDGGLEALRTSGREYQPTSDLAQYTDIIRRSLKEQPARTIAEACERIKGLTGIERRPTQVRCFLKSIGLKWQRVRAIPVPPKKVWQSTTPFRPASATRN
jgi:transposase